MQLLFRLLLLKAIVFLCSAEDFFQGLGELRYPCFDTYDLSNCNATLVDSCKPDVERASSNIPSTKFFLFTSDSPDKAEDLSLCGGLPPHSIFDPNSPTIVIVHGYSDGVCRTAWMREVKDQLFLKSKKYNVILVDWTWGNFPDIATTPESSIYMGHQLDCLMKGITNQTGYDCANFHLVCHSYGCIGCSRAGKLMQDKECRLGRLTTMESAFPPMRDWTEEQRVNPGDALLVDSIYTNGGECFPFNIGDPRPMGHVNFYFNDGTHQNACYLYAMQSLLKLDVFYGIGSLIYPALCYHVQAVQYFKVSILAKETNTQMIGVECDSNEAWMNGSCKRNCEKAGHCLPPGLDLPEYLDTSNLDNNVRRIFRVPGTLTCPYDDHTGFTGLPLKPIK